MIGTIQQVVIASVIALPIGVLTAIYLVEYGLTGAAGSPGRSPSSST